MGIGESRFHQLRQEALQAALAALEPRPAGRPSRPPEPGEGRIVALERELREREWKLHACRIRLELAEALSSLRRDAAVKNDGATLPLVTTADAEVVADRTGGAVMLKPLAPAASSSCFPYSRRWRFTRRLEQAKP